MAQPLAVHEQVGLVASKVPPDDHAWRRQQPARQGPDLGPREAALLPPGVVLQPRPAVARRQSRDIAQGLDYVGGDDYGLVCSVKRGSVTEEQRAAVESWLKGRSELTKVEVSPLLDAWYPEKPINKAE